MLYLTFKFQKFNVIFVGNFLRQLGIFVCKIQDILVRLYSENGFFNFEFVFNLCFKFYKKNFKYLEIFGIKTKLIIFIINQ